MFRPNNLKDHIGFVKRANECHALFENLSDRFHSIFLLMEILRLEQNSLNLLGDHRKLFAVGP